MSHLLTSLAGRAMGIASTIEPLCLPIFGAEPAAYVQERTSTTSGFTYADIITRAQTTQPASMQTPAGSWQTVASRDQPESVAASPIQSVTNQPRQGLTEDQQTTPGLVKPQSNEPTDSSTLLASPSRLIESVVVEPGPSDAELSPVASQTPRSDDRLTLREEQGPKAVDILSEQQAFSNSHTYTSTETSLRPRAFFEPPSLSMGMVDRLTQESNSNRGERPTIKVTIGRIEVRAITTPPAQPSRQRKKTKPALSLDDYLKQRAGGH